MKHTIWSNFIDMNDWKDYLEENDLQDESFDKQYEAVADLNQEYWYDEHDALKDCGKKLPARIIAIADLGLWYGRRQAYKFIDNLEDCLNSECDYFELYCDQHQLRSRGAHHDGTNYVTYYLLNDIPGVDKFIDDLYYGKEITQARLHKYTRSLRPYLKEYYGW